MEAQSCLKMLKEKLVTLKVDAFVVGSGDAHQSEYVHESDMRRSFISGFNGSAGTALVISKSESKSLLWTDGRYFLQASQQLSSDWELMKSGEPNVLEINDWILANLPTGSIIGIDPYLISAAQAEALEKILATKQMSLYCCDENPIDTIWIHRPLPSLNPIQIHSLSRAGQSYSSKITAIQSEIKKQKAQALIVSMLDEIMWLFNIRGNDVDFNPVVISYAVITLHQGTHLFVNSLKVSSDVRKHLTVGEEGVDSSNLQQQKVEIHEYDEIHSFLLSLSSLSVILHDSTANAVNATEVYKVMADPTQLNYKLYSCLTTTNNNNSNSNTVPVVVTDCISPITLKKAIKNEVEIQGIRNAHIRDGVALTAFLYTLELLVKKQRDLQLPSATSSGSITTNNNKRKVSAMDGKDDDNNCTTSATTKLVDVTTAESLSNSYIRSTLSQLPSSPLFITEYDVTNLLELFRRKMEYHVSPSFDTIAGYGSNGAIIHYKPKQCTAAALGTASLFLLDSGAQYLDGTTDVTRTLQLKSSSNSNNNNNNNNNNKHMKECYTRVLKGHIALAQAIFPEGTLGSRLDALARQSLWQCGLDYNHGTGHGVGAYLNVHEGPQGIGFRKRDNEAGFQPGMTISNEPGYYEEGNFGIRIENVCITVEADTKNHFNNKKYCKFETVTMVPIKTDLIDLSLLTIEEVKWLDTYHAQVRHHLLPLMQTYFPHIVDYLIQETEPVKWSLL